MKVNTRLIALMVSLAAGSAAAAGSGLTPAGTIISNTATANFTDPSTGTAAPAVTSNAVTTTVLPIAGFDIQYATTTLDQTTGNDTGTNSIPGAYKVGGVIPTNVNQDQVATAYVAVNTGNVPNYVVNLTANDTGSPAGTPASVKYYAAAADTNNDGILSEAEVSAATPITSVTIPADDVTTTGVDEGQVKFFQVLVVPSSATSGAIYAASPQGSAPAGAGSTVVNTYAAVNEASTDLQFTQAIVFTPTVVTFPTPPVDPAIPTTPSPSPTSVVTPPTANPAVPTNPVSPPGTSSDPSDPSVPGYVATPPAGTPAGTPGTPIVVNPSGNNQVAYPPADTNATPDTVIFNNVVSTPVVIGTPADRVTLFPTVPGGGTPPTGAGAYDPVTNSFPITTPNGPATVQFTDLAGNPLPTITVGGVTLPYLDMPKDGGTVPYRTVVTYPDSNSVTNPVPVVITVGVDSGNDADTNSNGTTTNTIMPPAAAFGDVPASGTTADPTLIGQGNTAQVIYPGSAAGTGAPVTTNPVVTSPPNTTPLTGSNINSTAVFPMTINNTGEYNDTYTLVGTVPILLTDGTTVNVPVRYVDATGTSLSSGTTTTASTILPSGSVIPAGTPTYVTPLVPANSDATVFAVIDIPANAAATTTANPNALVIQNAVGNFSTIPMEDTTKDQINIAIVNTNPDPITGNPTSGIDVDKYQTVDTAADPAVVAAPVPTVAEKNAVTALPGDTIKYAIIAKNNYNTSVANFVLSDSAAANNVYTYSNLVSATATATGFTGIAAPTVYYKVNGAAWSTTAPAAGTVITTLDVAVDTNADSTITAADIVPALATIRLDIVVTIK